MVRSVWVALAGLVFAGALVFGACGGDDESDGDDDSTPAATSAANGTSEPEPTADGGDGGGGGGDGDLEAVAERFHNSTFRAAYEVVEATADGPFGTDSELSIYKDGPERLRFDMTGTVEGEAFEGSFIVNGADSFVCFTGEAATSVLGEEGGEGACLASGADDPTNPIGALSSAFDFDPTDVDLKDTSEREIAGMDATCYTVVTASEGNAESTACFSDGGALLAMESEGSKIEASEASEDVSDADFEAPYPIVEIPGLGQ